jgi:hypothetical protein
VTTRGIYDDFLEDNPDILTAALRPQTQRAGRGSSFLDYWRRNQGDVWQGYLSNLGQQALAGQEPSGTYQTFARNYPWMDYWQRLSPRQRGENRSALAPRLRWNL